MSDAGEYVTVKQLVDQGILERPMDGNHGESHPKVEDFVSTGVPFITATDIKNGKVDIRECAFISEEQAKSLRKGFAKLGDVLLTHKATIGRTAIVDEIPDGLDWIVLTPQVTYYRVLRKDVLDPRYLKLYFDSSAFQTLLESWSGAGSTRAYLGITNQLDLPILVLPIDKQRNIVTVLGALDDKIEQNRRTGQTLEGLAWATFKAWFVDFEPVKAKTAGAAAFPGMPVKVFAALPKRLVDSPIGPVPEGWNLVSLPKLAMFLNGLALQKYPARGDGSDLPVIKIAELRKGSSENADTANSDVPTQFVVNDGDLLFSWSGTLDVQRWFGGRGALNQHLFKVTPSRHPLWFVHQAILQHLPEFRAIASSKATTMGHIQRKHLDAATVAVPTESILLASDELIRPIYALSAKLRIENRGLAALRDYLLPRLLTGKVHVQMPEGTDGH